MRKLFCVNYLFAASAMTGVRAGFGGKLKALGAVDRLQFTDVAHECESSVRTAVEGLAFHSEILTVVSQWLSHGVARHIGGGALLKM